MTTLNQQLFDAVAELAKANDRVALVRDRLAVARREETDAINAANKAQKEFDSIVAEVKKLAPQGTDWKATRGLPA